MDRNQLQSTHNQLQVDHIQLQTNKKKANDRNNNVNKIIKQVHAEAARGNTEAVLSEIEANWSELEAADEHGNTALLLAVIHNHYHTAQSLIKRGADITAFNFAGKVAQDLTSDRKMQELITRALSKIPNDDDDQNENSSLHVACSIADYDTAKQILSQCFGSVHARNKLAQTPLHCLLTSPIVCDKKTIDSTKEHMIKNMVDLLLEYNTDLNVCDQQYQTPLHLVRNLASAPLRVHVASKLIEHRSSFPRGLLRSELELAKHQYGGDIAHMYVDQQLIDACLGRLSGIVMGEEGWEAMWVYIGHLHSLHGEFARSGDQSRLRFEEFSIDLALYFRARTLFEISLCIELDLVVAKLLPLPKPALLSLLFDELLLTLESLRCYQQNHFIHNELNVNQDYLEDLQISLARNLLHHISKLNTASSSNPQFPVCYVFPTGWNNHAVYLNIEHKQTYNQQSDRLFFRLDNLGQGVEKHCSINNINVHRHAQSQPSERKINRAYPKLIHIHNLVKPKSYFI